MGKSANSMSSMASRSPNCSADHRTFGVLSQSLFSPRKNLSKYLCSSLSEEGSQYSSYHSWLELHRIHLLSCGSSNHPRTEPIVWMLLKSLPLMKTGTWIFEMSARL